VPLADQDEVEGHDLGGLQAGLADAVGEGRHGGEDGGHGIVDEREGQRLLDIEDE
jgi:hypothetical protein